MHRLKSHFKQFRWHFGHMWSVGFGLGYLPYAPGTWGSFLAIPLAYWARAWPVWQVLCTWCVLCVFSCWTADQTAKRLKEKDPSCIVCDEVVGCWLPLMVIPWEWGWVSAAFILFRVFDITKLWPACVVDRRPEGWAIVLDDCIAGSYAALLCCVCVEVLVKH